ncbi:MAG TPA: hypothetical protein VGZ27_15670 [Vicinamibacterales bacterium]|jgi:hypothetical protein|nr:hypothetical protein [Vicinamibacterales bacterium]
METITVHLINTTKSEAQAALKSTQGLALNSNTRVIIVVAASPRLTARKVPAQGRRARSTPLTFWPRLSLRSLVACT